jgi:hypothetical protein
MSIIAISFTSSASSVYNFVFDKFLEDGIPRTYEASQNFSFSVNGTALLTGPARQQRYIWAISTILDDSTAAELDEMFQAWDIDRAQGLSVAIGLIDSTFGDTLNKNTVFSTPPTFQKFGPNHKIVSFGLTEV